MQNQSIEKKQNNRYNVSTILSVIDSTNNYPLQLTLLHQLAIDLAHYNELNGADTMGLDLLCALRIDLEDEKITNTTGLMRVDLKRPRFNIAEAFRAKTPKKCSVLLVFKFSLLKSLLDNSRPLYLCERIARQIRLSCKHNDIKLDLLKEQSKLFDHCDMTCSSFINLYIDLARNELESSTNLHKYHKSLFRDILDFFVPEIEPNVIEPNVIEPNVIEPGYQSQFNFQIHDISNLKEEFQKITSSNISKTKEHVTFRWIENLLSRGPYSTERLNFIERFELIANLNELFISKSSDDKWICLLIHLIYSCGTTIDEVNQLQFDLSEVVSRQVSFRRKLRKPSDSGQVAHPDICEPQVEMINLPLNEQIKELLIVLVKKDTRLAEQIPFSIREQKYAIKQKLEIWREYGRFRLTLGRLKTALATEIAIRTHHPTLIHLLASKANHAEPTSSYYTSVSHAILQNVWKECQQGLYCYE